MIGYLSTVHKDQEKFLKLFVIPLIDKSLILGIDFWKEFQLAPGLIAALEIEDLDKEVEAHSYILDIGQRQQL